MASQNSAKPSLTVTIKELPHNPRIKWIGVVILLGLLVVLLALMSSRKQKCKSDKDCSHMCPDPNVPCRGKCEGGRCIAAKVICPGGTQWTASSKSCTPVIGNYLAPVPATYSYLPIPPPEPQPQKVDLTPADGSLLKIYKSVIDRIQASFPKWKELGNGEMFAKALDGTTYRKDAYGLISMSDSQGNWWSKGTSDFWWLKERDGSTVKKDGKGQLWKNDIQGNSWYKALAGQTWARNTVANLASEMVKDIAQSRIFAQLLGLGTTSLPESASACGMAETVNVYGNLFKLDQPQSADNHMLPSLTLDETDSGGVDSNITLSAKGHLYAIA